VLETFRTEIDHAMALTGCARVTDVGRELLG
jgi:isopentenyl diphosphate isomerase/L-lactate dehydrogenase-like FMN-dependent dehydrogenase